MTFVQKFFQKRRKTVRGSRPDGKSGGRIYLFKNVSRLRLTYQIRLLAFSAHESGGVLVIHVREGTALSPRLDAFINEFKAFVVLERS